MEKIVLCPNPYRDTELKVTKRARSLLESAGHSVVVSPVFVDIEDGSGFTPLKYSAETAELIVILGGDGTLLHVARETMGREIPLVCVDLGSRGFMAELEPNELWRVADAAKGRFRRSRRMMLDVELIRGGEVVFRDSALNDAVIKSPLNCVDVEVCADGVRISRITGDGVLVATPTGSTAYSMSAGGPIVEPEAENIIVTPICAHIVAARSFVLSPERRVTIAPERIKGREALLSVDGGEGIVLQSGDVIAVKRSEHRVILADMGVKSFYDTVFDKLTIPKSGGSL